MAPRVLKGLRVHIGGALRQYGRGENVAPPAFSKRRHLIRLAEERRPTVFVESGTYFGDTAAALARHVSRVVTIEIEPALARRARVRLAALPNVEVIEGDTLDLLPGILAKLTDPVLVYLDGHHSGGGTGKGSVEEPAVELLRLMPPLPAGSTVVIDDLNTFGRFDTAPQLDELTAAARAAFPASRISAGIDCLVVKLPL